MWLSIKEFVNVLLIKAYGYVPKKAVVDERERQIPRQTEQFLVDSAIEESTQILWYQRPAFLQGLGELDELSQDDILGAKKDVSWTNVSN